MIAGVTRYQQRPPQLDAVLVTAGTVRVAIAWLAAYGRDAYVVGQALRVVAHQAGERTVGEFEVPFGHHLIRDVASGDWAPVPPGQLSAEYEPLPGQAQPWEQRYGSGTVTGPAMGREVHVQWAPLPATVPPPRLGQPGHGV